jgi:uroporphyrinogen decarboxylase
MLHFVPETIQLLKKTLPVPLIGFCGGPYTVCRYMERLTPEWLDQVTTASISYLKLQIAAGVDAIQIFDSWAGLLSPADFNTLALPYLKKLIDAIKPHNIPIILFMRGSSHYIPELISLAPNCLAVDWETDLAALRQTVPSHISLQGNLNPSLLNGSLSSLQPVVLQLLSSMQNARGFIFNLGHGIEPEARVGNVLWLIDHIKQKVR